MTLHQQNAVRALLKYDIASTNIELVEYLVEDLHVPVAMAWNAVRRRHAVSRGGDVFEAGAFESADAA